MLKIIVKDDEIIFKGHAAFAEFGKDIVCAAASSIMYTTINAMSLIDKTSVEFKEGKDEVIVSFRKRDDIINKLIINMVNLLKELESYYPKNISIKEE